MLKHFKITPFFVFDGDSIQVKKDTEQKRADKRDENRRKAHALYESGDKRLAYDFFQKCVSITPEMAKCVIEYLQVNSIPYVVAPYEADAQMVYLEKHGLVQGIISEDSDLLVFGCKRLITKLNDNAECIEIDRKDFVKLNQGKFPLGKLNDDELISLVCLSGCDYTAGIPKVGLVTAMKYVIKNKSMENTLTAIRRDGKHSIPDKFFEEYEYANFAFRFQRVWCPIAERLATLNTVPPDLANCEKLFHCIGLAIHKDHGTKQIIHCFDDIDHALHRKICHGELNPYNFHKPLINREHKVRLQSQSVVMTIDKFCNKPSVGTQRGASNKKVSSIARKSNSVNIGGGGGIMTKLELAFKRRKLTPPETNAKKTEFIGSEFFSQNMKKMPTPPDNETRNNTRQIKSEFTSAVPTSEVFDDSFDGSFSDSLASAPGSDSLASIISLDSADESETQIDPDDIETEIPSSMVPTQTENERETQTETQVETQAPLKIALASIPLQPLRDSTTPAAPAASPRDHEPSALIDEESEILSEMEDQPADVPPLAQQLNDNRVLASLREKFLHTDPATTASLAGLAGIPAPRIPLRNVTNIRTTPLHAANTAVKPTTALPALASGVLRQRPAVRTMSGALSTLPRTPSPSISLSQFAYSRKKA